MDNCRRITKSKQTLNNKGQRILLNPLAILKEAYQQVIAPGSATALICTLNGKELACGNLGDSGFMLIRFDDCYEPFVVARSVAKQHAFNTPYQLAKLPSETQITQGLKKRCSPGEIANILFRYRRLSFCKDSPEDSSIYKERVKAGDLLLLATDGVFDNLFQEEILSIVKQLARDEEKRPSAPEKIAIEIARRAYYKSINLNEKTPFGEEAQKNGEPECTVRLGVK